jgi:hypothetical protein
LKDAQALKKIGAWEIFRMGACMDDFELARAAIRVFDTADPDFASKPLSSYDGMPLKYCHAFMSRLYRPTTINRWASYLDPPYQNVEMGQPRTAVEIASCFAL